MGLAKNRNRTILRRVQMKTTTWMKL